MVHRAAAPEAGQSAGTAHPVQPEEPTARRTAGASDAAHAASAAAHPAPQRTPTAHPAPQRIPTARPARPAAERPAADVPLVLHQNGETLDTAGLRDIRTARPTAGQTAAAEMAWKSGTPTLTFVKAARQQPPEPPQEKPPAARNLPDWARELLEKPAGRNASAASGRQIQWTAPQAVPVPPARPSASTDAAVVPPSLLHRERGGDDDLRSTARQAEREAEIRRTADKVYRIIEERLRRELRRSGR